MSEKTPNTQTNFLCDIISLTLTGENVSGGDGWRKMPLIPTHQELTEDFLEKDKNLSPVNIKSGYESSDEYMNTYFRLLRAETFSAIQHGIKDLKTGKLDSRDMNVYHNVRLVGLEVKYGRFSLAIHFTSAKHVKKWEASPQLMFGNLVCISMNRKFDDVIWGTISNRDTDILNENQVIMVEVIDKNFKSMSEIMNSLQANAGIYVCILVVNIKHSTFKYLSLAKSCIYSFAITGIVSNMVSKYYTIFCSMRKLARAPPWRLATECYAATI